MSRTKIAPVLSALLKDLARQANEPRKKSYPMPGDAGVARLATAEHRALVAVYRAVKDLPHADECREFGFDAAPDTCNCWKRTVRRLDSLSAPVGARSGRGR
jgi:hypothetical protein